jgi:hypothetical protein
VELEHRAYWAIK